MVTGHFEAMTVLPMVERELRLAARKAGTYWLRSAAAFVAMAAMLLVMIGNGATRGAELSMEIFAILTMMAMAFCLLAGVFLTSDSLSSERRDGTAGLLFLTDLRGYDVVLGKLAGSSLHACYGLISIFPVLAIPLLMGGVTVAEFWRVVLALAMTLFFSLAAGTMVSAFGRESRQTMLGTLLLISMVAAVLPALHVGSNVALHTGTIRPLLWPSPGFAYLHAFESYYRYGKGAPEYWGSLVTVVGMGMMFLTAASFHFPRAWQEKAQAGPSEKIGSWGRIRFGARAARAKARARLLPEDPFLWLAMRDRLPKIIASLLVGAAVVLCAMFMAATINSSRKGAGLFFTYQIAIFVAIGAGLIFKCLVAMEASRRLNDDRQSGALELLLVTPLPVEQIIRGQRRALSAQFVLPMFVLMLIFPGLLWLTYFLPSWKLSDGGVSGVVFVGNILVMMSDFLALNWIGMWTGLRARQHYRAVLGSLARVLVLPWIAYFLILMLAAGKSVGNDSMMVIFGFWFVLGVVNDLIWGGLARVGLGQHFRPCATGAKAPGPGTNE